ncbi:unnamed protein product [Euphydryas editha]|uniref:Uncharacterized protein n=1 Tax=Euphydryas editha TaxID=104508 RepID=A0AAU9TYX0_EUPED|nr:unnamed protein product [Euphydryas editha]
MGPKGREIVLRSVPVCTSISVVVYGVDVVYSDLKMRGAGEACWLLAVVALLAAVAAQIDTRRLSGQ